MSPDSPRRILESIKVNPSDLERKLGLSFDGGPSSLGDWEFDEDEIREIEGFARVNVSHVARALNQGAQEYFTHPVTQGADRVIYITSRNRGDFAQLLVYALQPHLGMMYDVKLSIDAQQDRSSGMTVYDNEVLRVCGLSNFSNF